MRKNNILLYGLGCSGKSYALATLLKIPGLKLRMLATDRNAIRGLETGIRDYKINLVEGQLIVNIVKARQSSSIFKKAAVNHQKYLELGGAEAMAVKIERKDRLNYKHFLDIQMGLAEFVGIDYFTKAETNCGNIGDWDETNVLAIDGLTAINNALWDETKATRVDPIQSDYMAIQVKLNTLINNLTQHTECSVILPAHAKKAVEDVTGIERISPDVPGNALAGRLLGYFDNGIYAHSDSKGNFFWAGKKLNVETAARDLPAKDGLTPDFSLPEYGFFNDFN